MRSDKPIAEFLSEASEVHAMWFGFYSAWFSLMRDKLPEELEQDIKREYHYYTAGYFIGRLTQAILAILGVRLVL